MAITEWQGACGISPWGFIIGIILGAAAELVAYRQRKRIGTA
jgi:F0F1-type ATP synthase assembly protein I